MAPSQQLQAVKRILLLVGLLLVGDRIFGWGLGQLTLASKARYSVLYGGREKANVVILGNSRGVNGFYAPTLEGVLQEKVMNLSYNGLSMELAEALLRDWVDLHGAPRLIILEASNVSMGNDVIEGLAPYWSCSDRLGAIADRERPSARTMTRVSHLYRYNGELFLRALWSLRRSDQTWINHYRITPGVITEIRGMAPITFSASEANLMALSRIMEFARQQRIAIRVIVTPYFDEYLRHVKNYDAWKAQVERAAGAPIWDEALSETDREHFADGVHLNDLAAQPIINRLRLEGFFESEGEHSKRN